MAGDERPIFEMDRLVSYDDASLIAEMQRVATLVAATTMTRAEYDRQARASSSMLVRRFGGWREALEAAGLGGMYGGQPVSDKMRDQRARAMTTEEVVAELKRIADVLGTSVLRRTDVLRHSTLIGERVVNNRFGSWRAALEAAGLELSSMGRRWTDDDYFENLLAVWTHYGRPPTYAELNLPPSKISNGGYASKFGSWGLAKQAFVERVNADLQTEFAPVEPTARREPTAPRPRQEDQRNIPIGLRYETLRRDRFRCVACGRSPATDAGCVLHVDHILAFSRGGKTRLDNLQALCEQCNIGKGAR